MTAHRNTDFALANAATSDAAIHPKTFHVIVRDALGFGTSLGLSFYLHAETWTEVLARLEAMLPGIDTQPTIRRKTSAPDTMLRVGNSDPVVIQDVDMFALTERVNGKFVRSDAPVGHWRRSKAEVAKDLYKIASMLREHSQSLMGSFAHLRQVYELGRTQESAYDRLLQIKETIERLDVWHENVWREYRALRPQSGLEMPERRVSVNG